MNKWWDFTDDEYQCDPKWDETRIEDGLVWLFHTNRKGLIIRQFVIGNA